MIYPYRITVNSPLGKIVVQGSDTHIQYLKFAEAQCHKEVEPELVADSALSPRWGKDCQQQLEQYFAAEIDEFDLPIDPQGTEFQQRVWHSLCDITYGTFASYQQLAMTVGNSSAVRAVASANASNPIWLIIPCHRVIGRDRALRGYAGGIERKAQLLQLEKHTLDAASAALINEKTKVID